jgi:hypothetical protein
MGCYVIPATSAIVHFILRKKIPSLKSNTKHLWLNQLFLGAAIFGVVDHWWNGELLAFSLKDMLLGFIITMSIIVVWKIMDIYSSRVITTHKSIN